jgi:hypothetical protein
MSYDFNFAKFSLKLQVLSNHFSVGIKICLGNSALILRLSLICYCIELIKFQRLLKKIIIKLLKFFYFSMRTHSFLKFLSKILSSNLNNIGNAIGIEFIDGILKKLFIFTSVKDLNVMKRKILF